MPSNILAFVNRSTVQQGWTNAELAELYRVENALAQARISVETDHGTTDEGDPWFVFCRPGGEVIVHATRFGGLYRLYSPALPDPLSGPSFSTLTKSFVSGLRIPVQANNTVAIHPSALLTLLVAAIFYSFDFHSGSAKAAEAGEAQASPEAAGKAGAFHVLVAHITAVLDPSKVQAATVFATMETAAIVAAVAYVASSFINSDGQKEAQTEFVVADAHEPASDWQDRVSAEHAMADTRLGVVDASKVAADDQLLTDENRLQTVTPDATNKLVLLQADGQLNGVADVIIGGRIELAAASSTVGNDTVLLSDFERVQFIFDDRGAVGDKLSGLGSDSPTVVWFTNTSGDIDVAGFSNAQQILISGSGELRIAGLAATANPELVFSAGSDHFVSLAFASSSSASFVYIRLEGEDHLTLAGLSSDQSAVHITVDSEGASANSVSISDEAISNTDVLDLTVVGAQDFTLRESFAAFQRTILNASGLTGALTLGLDLSDVFHTVDLSQVDAANFIVGTSGNVFLLHAASGSNIQLTKALNIVDITVDGTSDGTATKLSLNLQSEFAVNPIAIAQLNTFYTANLTLNSSHAGLGGLNFIDNLNDSSLSLLTITGDSGLAINSITGITADDAQSVTIDAHALTGNFSINVSDISDVAGSGRSIVMIGGMGSNILTNLNSTQSTNFIVGDGENVINIGGGAVRNSVSNLKPTDIVNVGSGDNSDVLFSALGSHAQGTIDSQVDLTAAAQTASDLNGSNVLHQALVFSYQGNTYVFIDAAGNHAFDASHDAIVKLVGVSASTDLTGVFHSA